MIGSLWCHWPSGTLFRLAGLQDGDVFGYDDAGAFGIWPEDECARVAE